MTHILSLRSRIQTLETCCAAQLCTGRSNKYTRELERVRAELQKITTNHNAG